MHPNEFAAATKERTSLMDKTMIERTAILSNDGLYRYRLTRTWNRSLPLVTYLMLNPSTADELRDDATIRKCLGFAERWGFGGIEVTNLFALRSRDPQALVSAPAPIGPDYTRHLYDSLYSARLLVAAWGCEGTLKKSSALAERPQVVLATIRMFFPDLPIECLGMSKTGNPYHPLMLAYDTPRWPYDTPRIPFTGGQHEREA